MFSAIFCSRRLFRSVFFVKYSPRLLDQQQEARVVRLIRQHRVLQPAPVLHYLAPCVGGE